MRSNARNGGKPNRIVSAWCKEDGYCLGQKSVAEKSNEITTIPEVLDKINIKNQIVTIDAMGTQTAIAEKIRSKRADYVLALKGNQTTLLEYYSQMEFEYSKVTGNQWQENVTKEKKVSCWSVSNETSGGYSEAVTFSKKSDSQIPLGWTFMRLSWRILCFHLTLELFFDRITK